MKNTENEINFTTNSTRNSISSSGLNKNYIFNNNNVNLNNSVYDIDENTLMDEKVKKIKRNYVEYYTKNLNNLEKFKFYNEILDSIIFENKEPEMKELVIIDKLFSINSEDHQYINESNINDSVNQF